jgi:serralysin
VHEGRDPNACFDTSGYLAVNRDVAAAWVDPQTHYEHFARFEGRDPNAWFDTAGYLLACSDVAAAGVNPLDHVLTFGIFEGRQPIYDEDYF